MSLKTEQTTDLGATQDKNPNKMPFGDEFDGLNRKSSRQDVLRALHRHFKNTRGILAAEPELVGGQEEAQKIISRIDQALNTFQKPEDLPKTLKQKAGECKAEGLGNTGLSGFFQDAGDAIENTYNDVANWVEKNVFDNIIKFNPISVAARGLIREIVQSIDPLSQAMRVSFIPLKEAKRKGYTESEWKDFKNQREALADLYINKFKGDQQEFRGAIMSGEIPTAGTPEIFKNCEESNEYEKNEDRWINVRHHAWSNNASSQQLQYLWENRMVKAQLFKWIQGGRPSWMNGGECLLGYAGLSAFNHIKDNVEYFKNDFNNGNIEHVTDNIKEDFIGNVSANADRDNVMGKRELFANAHKLDFPIRSVTFSRYRNDEELDNNENRYNQANDKERFVLLTRAIALQWLLEEMIPDFISTDNIDSLIGHAGNRALNVINNGQSQLAPKQEFIDRAKNYQFAIKTSDGSVDGLGNPRPEQLRPAGKVKKPLRGLGQTNGEIKHKKDTDFCRSGYVEELLKVVGVGMPDTEDAREAEKQLKESENKVESSKNNEPVVPDDPGTDDPEFEGVNGLGGVGIGTIATILSIVMPIIGSIIVAACTSKPGEGSGDDGSGDDSSGDDNGGYTIGSNCSTKHLEENQQQYEEIRSQFGEDTAAEFDRMVRAELAKYKQQGVPGWMRNNNNCPLGMVGYMVMDQLKKKDGNVQGVVDHFGLTNHLGQGSNIKVRSGGDGNNPVKPDTSGFSASLGGWGTALALGGLVTGFFVLTSSDNKGSSSGNSGGGSGSGNTSTGVSGTKKRKTTKTGTGSTKRKTGGTKSKTTKSKSTKTKKSGPKPMKV